MSVDDSATNDRFLLENIDWATYLSILEAQDERRVRVTYDRGKLELMKLSFVHERDSLALGRIVEELAYALCRPILSAGSVTLKRRAVARGLEPDKCFYLAHEASVRGKAELDLDFDPPPDLAVEVDMSRSRLDRVGICAGLGIPEVWRWNRGRFLIYHSDERGEYAATETSLAFPYLRIDHLQRIMAEVATIDHLTWLASLRRWIRTEVVPRFPDRVPT